jgi:hypothetical protein
MLSAKLKPERAFPPTLPAIPAPQRVPAHFGAHRLPKDRLEISRPAQFY